MLCGTPSPTRPRTQHFEARLRLAANLAASAMTDSQAHKVPECKAAGQAPWRPEPGVGIEPTTSALQERCSTN